MMKKDLSSYSSKNVIATKCRIEAHISTTIRPWKMNLSAISETEPAKRAIKAGTEQPIRAKQRMVFSANSNMLERV